MAFSVRLPGFLRFFGYVEGIGCGELHAVGSFHGFDSSFEEWVGLFGLGGQVFLIEGLEEIELAALGCWVQFGIP